MNTSPSTDTNLVVSLLFCMAAALLLTACGTPPGTTERKASAVTALDGLIAQVNASSKQVDEMITATTALPTAPDLAAAFNQFAGELEDTHDAAEVAKKRRSNMQVNAANYIEDWRTNMSQVQSAELRESAANRAEAVRGMFEKVRAKADATSAAYDPFITNLNDLEAYLNNDLTPPAVKSAAPVIQKVNTSGQALKKALADYAAELNAVKTAMSAGTPAE